MYETFKMRDGIITGYHWKKENPDYVMCIVHGIGEHGARYNEMAEFLGESNIAILSMDHRGHGRSQGKRGHCAPRKEVLEDVSALIEQCQKLYKNKPIILYGHSMGGNIVLDYRNRGRLNETISKYIVSAPWIRLVRPVPKPLYLLTKVASKLFPKMSVCSACPKELLGHPNKLKDFDEDKLIHDRVTLQTAVEGFDIGLAIENGSHEKIGNGTSRPCLLMHGDKDGICSVEGSRKLALLSKENKAFTYKEWPEYFHEIHNGGTYDNGHKVLEYIRDYICNNK